MNQLRFLLTLIIQLHVSPTVYGMIGSKPYDGDHTHCGDDGFSTRFNIPLDGKHPRWNKRKIRRVLSRIRRTTLVGVWWRSTNSSVCFLKCRRWGMTAHWLQVESCRAGFRSKECLGCSVFYPSKNTLFIAQNLKQHSASEEKVKVIQGSVNLGTLYVGLSCWNNRELP